MDLLKFRTKKLCEAVLDFPTIKCKQHVCINDPLHELALAKEDRKHKCKCGVRWTKDPDVAGQDKPWVDAGELLPPARQPKSKGDEN